MTPFTPLPQNATTDAPSLSLLAYRLSLGVQDNLQEAVKELRALVGIEEKSLSVELRELLGDGSIMKGRIAKLGDLVPTRFLSPWLGAELTGVDGHQRTRLIHKLAASSQGSEVPTPYFFNSKGTKRIELNASWRTFLLKNIEVQRSFANFHLCRYLQAKNPNVPGIVNKLTIPSNRNLSTARTFWTEVQSCFSQQGEAHRFKDIYSGEVLPEAFSIDHFLPWSFVAHDLLWNLTPVSASTNSKKGDHVPDPLLYLPKLAQLHCSAIRVAARRPKLLEDYVTCFQESIEVVLQRNEEMFTGHYRRFFDPQIQIAVNQGFPANWSMLR